MPCCCKQLFHNMIVPLHVLHVVPPVSKFLESSFWDEGGRAAMADVQIYFGRSLSRASGNIGTCPRHTCGVSKDRNQAPLKASVKSCRKRLASSRLHFV